MSRFAAHIVITVLLILGGTQAAWAEKRVALVIGNGAYVNAPPLANPKNDAEDMATALESLGFTVFLGLDLNKRGMDIKILEFESALNDADAGVFYYTGHGLQMGGVNYLVPVDASLESAAALRIEAVRLDFVQETMERQAKTSILFVDSCRNNPLAGELARKLGTRSVEVRQGLAAPEAGLGTLISFSTQPGGVASDGSGRNSPYSGALAKAILTPGKDLSAILIDVRKEVLAITRERQVPWEHSALRAPFYFAPQSVKPPSTRGSEGPRLALLIGNQNYSKKVGPLSHPHDDIKVVGSVLEGLGFKVTRLFDPSSSDLEIAIKRYADEFVRRVPVRQASSITPAMVPRTKRPKLITSSRSMCRVQKARSFGTVP
jgi:uncharacterized caspase-like protein